MHFNKTNRQNKTATKQTIVKLFLTIFFELTPLPLFRPLLHNSITSLSVSLKIKIPLNGIQFTSFASRFQQLFIIKFPVRVQTKFNWKNIKNAAKRCYVFPRVLWKWEKKCKIHQTVICLSLKCFLNASMLLRTIILS